VIPCPDEGFAKEDLPEDTCESYRPAGSARPAASPPGGSLDGNAPEHGTAATQYKLESRIGVGGSGEVWSAVQVSLGRSVAVKRLHFHAGPRDPLKAARRLEDFRREAVITGRLDHPNIVPVYDLGTDSDGQPFLAMKLIGGTPWSQALKDDAAMPYDERLAKHLPTLIEICRAVSFAHARGVIHRDLKPSQVIIGKYGEVLLTDWGLAVTFRYVEGDIELEEEGVPNPAGTVAFMAPEQTGSVPARLGPWTDVWLLGGILYYILTLTPPHNQVRVQEAFDHAAAGAVEPPGTRAPGLPVPIELSAICMKALARDRAQRFASVEEFSGELSRFLSSTASRSESASLASRAASLYAASPGSYTDLQACDKLLQAAHEAWPANSEAAALRQGVLAHLVRLATSRGDLGMAEMQIQRLEDPAVADPLRAAVHKARRNQARRAAQSRLLLGAITLLAAAAVVLAGYGWRATVRNARIEAERRYAQKLAAKQIADEKQRAELLNSINSLRSEETSLSEELTKQLPYPTKLLYKDEAFGVTGEQRTVLDEMISHSAPLAALRARLLEQGVPLEPEPFALASARARLALHQSKTPDQALGAYSLAMSAARARPADYKGRVLLAIAAARAGFFTSATLHVRDAQVMASRQFTPLDPEMREITALYEQAFARSADIVPPGSVIVQSSGGGKDAAYREVSGVWFDSTSRSCAPGMDTSVPGRGCSLVGMPATQQALVKVIVPQRAPRDAFVYATWGPSANVERAQYAVHHADGVTTVCICQAGFGSLEELPFRGNGNLWIPLGRYRFRPDGGDSIEVSADFSSGNPFPRNDQRLYADAILFSPAPLTQATSTGPPAEGVAGEGGGATARPAAAPGTGQLEEFLVETHPLGMNTNCYEELSGAWSPVPPSLFAKSQAPGVTTSFKCGTRRIEPSQGGQDAVARFRLPLEEPGRYGVYVTWARTANARAVTYQIRHADGATSVVLQQRGLAGDGGVFDRWVCLGTFSFAAGAGQGVDIVVPAQVQPVSPSAPAIAYADAILFSKTAPESVVPLGSATE
jgi:serine/threonine protein kinase